VDTLRHNTGADIINICKQVIYNSKYRGHSAAHHAFSILKTNNNSWTRYHSWLMKQTRPHEMTTMQGSELMQKVKAKLFLYACNVFIPQPFGYPL